MRIEQLHFFLALIKSGSLSEASRKLFVSQQSLTYNMKSLEEELGYVLYFRTKNGIVLTKEGEVVYHSALSLLARYQQMLERIENLQAHRELDTNLFGELIIYVSPMISISILPKAYVEYINTYPRVKVASIDSYQNNTIKSIVEGRCDIGYILVGNQAEGFFKEIPEEVELKRLKKYQLYFALSPRHPLAQRQSLSLQAVKDYPLIIFEMGGLTGEHILKKLTNAKVELTSNNYKMCLGLVQERSEMLIMSFEPFIINHVFSDLHHIPFEESNVCFEFYVAYHKNLNAEKKNLIKSFHDVLEQYT